MRGHCSARGQIGTNVVNHKVVRDMQIAFPDSGGIFQHDLAPCHSAKKLFTRKWNKGFKMARGFARLEPHKKFMMYN